MPRQYWQGTEYPKSPIGVMPESIWKQSRLLALAGAIKRYADAAEPIPAEWVEEYNRLNKEIQDILGN